jgi:hypothetical protein
MMIRRSVGNLLPIRQAVVLDGIIGVGAIHELPQPPVSGLFGAAPACYLTIERNIPERLTSTFKEDVCFFQKEVGRYCLQSR